MVVSEHARAVTNGLARVLLLGALWAPASGVAHGLAHHRESHRTGHHHEALTSPKHRDHHGSPSSSAHSHSAHSHRVSSASAEGSGVSIRDVGEHDHHADPVVDEGLPSRVDAPFHAMAASPRVPVVAIIAVTHARVAYTTLPRADPATGPPPRLRDPPTV